MADKKDATKTMLNMATGGVSGFAKGDTKGGMLGMLNAATMGSTAAMTTGISSNEERREKKLQKQIDELKSPELVSGTPLAATTPEALNTAAETEAQKTIKKKKMTLLNTGGNTDITSGKGILAPGQVSKKTLLGG